MNDENHTREGGETMTVIVKSDKALVDRLTFAQLNHAKANIESYQMYPGSDDGLDYLQAAIQLAGELLDFYVDTDTARLDEFLNTPDNLAANYACDGICNELYELNCPALPKEI
jgi:hypothetical protein